MKTFTFNVNKKTISNNTSNIRPNNTSYINNLVLSNLKKVAPYCVDDDYLPEVHIPSKKKINITVKTKKRNTSSYEDFINAVKYFANKSVVDTYDFILPDGTPVKIFDDEIQIGYDLIPLNGFTKAMYDALSESAKKNVIDIYINIKK